MFCDTYCICNRYDIKTLKSVLSTDYEVEIFDDVIACYSDKKLCFHIFSFGVVVFWDIAPGIQKSLLNTLKPFSIDILDDFIHEKFEFKRGDKFEIKDDIFYFDSDNYEARLSMAFAFSQSVKLDVFELRVEQLISKTKDIPLSLREYGKIKLSSKNVAKIRGEIFSEISSVNLLLDFLGTPNFFWVNPGLEEYYNRVFHYLDVSDRIAILNKKLSILHDIFNMLSDEQKHTHSSFLEWIIIILIVIEIVFFAWLEFF